MLLIRQDSHLFLEGGVWRAACNKWIFITIVLLLTHKTAVSLDTALFGKVTFKSYWCINSNRAPTCKSELPARGPGQGGETLSEALSSLIYGQRLG